METWVVLLTSIGFIVFVTGIVLIIIGIILAVIRRSSQDHERDDEEEEREKSRRTRGAGVVLIGPIPIVFGTDRGALIIALAAVVAILIFYVIVLSNS